MVLKFFLLFALVLAGSSHLQAHSFESLEGFKTRIETVETLLAKNWDIFQNHFSELDQLEKLPDNPVLNCPICLGNLAQASSVVVSSCSHLVCKNCFSKLSEHNDKCPICRKPSLDRFPVLLGPSGVKRYITNLLMQRERPSIDQIKKIPEHYPLPDLKNMREYAASVDNHQFDYPHWFDVLRREAPYLIASLEKAFPGATWAFIGRDMAIFADLFESFYLNLSQEGRVVRIEMSRETLAEITPDLAMEFLNSSGFHSDLKYPFIFVDSISVSNGQQPRYLIDTLYRKMSHIPISTLLSKINFVGLPVKTTQIQESPLNDVQAILDSESKKYQNRSGQVDFYSDHKILTYTNQNIGASEYLAYAGYEDTIGTWAGPYGKLIKEGEKVAAQIGSASPIEMRNSLLLYQAHVVTLGQTPQFLQAVKAAAQSLDYEFPLTRPEEVKVRVRNKGSCKSSSPGCFSGLGRFFGIGRKGASPRRLENSPAQRRHFRLERADEFRLGRVHE